MTARHLVIGLDGAELSLIEQLGPARLPHLHATMQQGAFAALRSVQPPATLPNWTTFLTALDPGRHGVFDFTRRHGYRVRFAAGTAREAPTLAARLDRLGLQCACAGFPATWPPERLQHGVFISGWDAPVAFEADRSFIWPESMYAEIQERFGTPRFDDVDEFDAESPGWHARLPEALIERIHRKAALAEWLLEKQPWDFFAFYFGESDTAAHHLWALHDPRSPRHPRGTTAREREGLARVYVALDEAVGRLWRAAGARVEITLVSDHGSGGASDKVLYLNRALQDAGLLTLRKQGARWPVLAKDWALTTLTPRMRERVFRLAGRRLPGWLESRARFGLLDWRGTLAFSDELNYFPAIHLNVHGREPEGIVAPQQVERVRRDVADALSRLRDPWSGTPVVEWVAPRESVFAGPFVDRAPDLLLGLHLDAGYSYNLMPSASAPAGTGAWRKLAPSEYLGRKGRSLPGSHRTHGFYAAAGPRVRPVGRIDAHIADATATVLARMGLELPAHAAGEVLEAVLEPAEAGRSLPEATLQTSQARADEALVEERLRALGYVD